MSLLRVFLLLLLMIHWSGCGGDGSATGPEIVTPPLIAVLPEDTRGVLAVNFDVLSSGEAAAAVAELLAGKGPDAALNAPFETIKRYTLGADIAATIESVVLAQTTNARDGLILVAKVKVRALADIFDAEELTKAAPHKGHAIYSKGDANRQLTLLRDGRLIVGSEAGVRAALDTFEGDDAGAEAGAIGPYLPSLAASGPFTFVYGLPALYREVDAPGPGTATLRQARAVSGAFSFGADTFAGLVSFHTDNAESFVTRFNELVADSDTAPLGVGHSGTVDIEVPSTAYIRTSAEILGSRTFFKKLVHGMDAVDFTDGVIHGGNVPWLNFDVGGDPNSIFINFEFKDPAQIRAFEANELPEGFKLAPIRILETDDPTYFLVFNAYQSSGGLVAGARAEWSVFVEDPEGGHPRFLVVQAAAASVSADSVNLLTAPKPVTHALEGGYIVSNVDVEDPDGGEDLHYFTSRIAWPQELEDRVEFTREFVAANDYIYWGNGVSDHGLYNGSVHNRDGVRIPDSEIEIIDDSRWGPYVKSVPKHSYVYLNPLEIVISPWWNLDAGYLDVTEDFRQRLIDFKNIFYPMTVRGVAEAAVAGEGDALAAFTVGNSVPSAYFNFVITDPEGLEGLLELPEGTRLAKIQILQDGTNADYYLSLRVYEVDGAPEGRRAEWMVYVDDGEGRPHALILDLLTEDAAADPVRFLQLPSVVEHAAAEGRLQTTLASEALHFAAEIDLRERESALPTLDWVETGDWICRLNGACDKIFYDGETMEAPVALAYPSAVNISRRSTPWDAFVAGEPAIVFVRENVQHYAWNPWRNVRDEF